MQLKQNEYLIPTASGLAYVKSVLAGILKPGIDVECYARAVCESWPNDRTSCECVESRHSKNNTPETIELGEGHYKIWRTKNDFGDLVDYKTGTTIRPATLKELSDSLDASKKDGGHGLIVVQGKTAYVQD